MSIIQKSKVVIAETLVVLKKTRKIEAQDLSLLEWQMLKNEYDENAKSEWVDKALVSMLNSIVFQRRVVFILTKRAFRELCQSDMNWTKKIGLKDESWKTFIHEATGRQLIKKVYGTSNGRLVYELINKEILDLLMIDRAKQYQEAIDFANATSDNDCDNRREPLREPLEGTTRGNREGEGEGELEQELELDWEEISKEVINNISLPHRKEENNINGNQTTNQTTPENNINGNQTTNQTTPDELFEIDLDSIPLVEPEIDQATNQIIQSIGNSIKSWIDTQKSKVPDYHSLFLNGGYKFMVSSCIKHMTADGVDLSDHELVCQIFTILVLDPWLKKDTEKNTLMRREVKDHMLLCLRFNQIPGLFPFQQKHTKN